MEFTAHNISFGKESTITGQPLLCEAGECKAVIRTLNNYFKEKENERGKIRIVDLGCLEGGYSVEFARNGYDVLGIEARDINFQKCQYVADRINLPNLKFIRDDVQNIDKYGSFDVTFCCGLLYHLDNPVSFINILGKLTSKMLILNTHYSKRMDIRYDMTPIKIAFMKLFFRKKLEFLYPAFFSKNYKYRNDINLSKLQINEGRLGRWFNEFEPDESNENIEKSLWAAYGNNRSFWLEKNELLQTIREAGFNAVYEQFDFLLNCSSDNHIVKHDRSIFIGYK
jgi:SAM-dependent methyltransferase